jgi:predicted histone-like DNA-binding protein
MNPRNLSQPKKYYAAAITSKNADHRDVINAIAKTSTVSTPDIVAVIESFFQLIPEYLKEGKIINVGDLGSFTVVLESEGQEKESDVHARTVKNVRIRFIPSKRLKEEVNRAEIKKYHPKKHGK